MFHPNITIKEKNTAGNIEIENHMMDWKANEVQPEGCVCSSFKGTTEQKIQWFEDSANVVNQARG